MKKLILIMIVAIFAIGIASAANATVCCEKTKASYSKGVLYCQNVPASECDASARQAPTSCESTSFCKPGICYNSFEGTCLDNTPQIVCTNNQGAWSATTPAQCELGCCILGDQAAFVSLVRCKRLSSQLGLQTNYKQNINTEVECVAQVQNQEKGACVYTFEFDKTCKFTTKAECSSGLNGTKEKGTFYAGKLCTSEEIGAPCSPTKKTTCLAGKDEVYFVDSCGNAANIYDASKVNDKKYWSDIVEKSKSCDPNTGGINSKSCGNCNYLLGSYCRPAEKSNGPSYGDFMCADLNCAQTSNGKSYKHGESWCVYNDKGSNNKANNAVGSRFYKHICINGEEVLEQCADFRQEECIEDKIETVVGGFSQAACRVNRWQDCTSQTEKADCENADRRDCIWKEGFTLGNSSAGACVPKNTPGLKFWEGEEAKSVCGQASASCVVVFEKGLLGGEKCKQNCDCLTESWTKQKSELCMALGDCGPKVNWVGSQGYKDGFKVTKN